MAKRIEAARQRPARGSAAADRAAREIGVDGSVFLGWKGAARDEAFGFGQGRWADVPADPAEPLLYKGDGHLMTVAPTGSGKGIGVIIPNLLTYPGSAIVVDIKGENYQVTARYRLQMGQRVVVLDPFGVVTDSGDSLDPFDLFDLPGAEVESDAEMIAAQFAVGHDFGSDRYWNDTARGLISGLIAHLASAGKPEERTPSGLRRLLYNDDMDYHLAVLLDTKAAGCGLARDEFVAYLSAPSDKTRPCIRSSATTFVKCLGSAAVAKAMDHSSFALADLLEGKPVTIYLVIPPEKLTSHGGVLRLWVATLLGAALRRKRLPKHRTLFLVDEAAQLGPMDLLRQSVTLMRGYGVQVWNFFQDLGQLRRVYKEDWESLVANSAAFQTFGLPGHGSHLGWRSILGPAAGRLADLGEGEMLISMPGHRSEIHRRANYLKDPAFHGRFDPNRRFLAEAEASATK